MDWMHDPQVLLWIAVALGAGVLEVLSLDLIFVMFAGGALGASAAAAFDRPVPVQVLVFAAVSALLIGAVRPGLKRWALSSAPLIATNSAALLGREAQVIEPVTTESGLVKLAGEIWTARLLVVPGPVAPQTAPIGSNVEVVAIDGATAVVTAPTPRPEQPAL